MKTLNRIVRGTGKVTLAILGCLLMPILVWVGLGTAIYQRNRVANPAIGSELTRAHPLTPSN